MDTTLEPGSGSAFESLYFDSDGLTLHYIDVGEGAPVVLLHGFSLDPELTWTAPEIVAALVDAGHRVVAYDFRGHGRSARLPAWRVHREPSPRRSPGASSIGRARGIRGGSGRG